MLSKPVSAEASTVLILTKALFFTRKVPTHVIGRYCFGAVTTARVQACGFKGKYSYGHSLSYGYLISPMKMRSL